MALGDAPVNAGIGRGVDLRAARSCERLCPFGGPASLQWRLPSLPPACRERNEVIYSFQGNRNPFIPRGMGHRGAVHVCQTGDLQPELIAMASRCSKRNAGGKPPAFLLRAATVVQVGNLFARRDGQH